ncbi:MAG: carbohydrate kinase [Bacteroidales bacterium]|nr:carbohydrate kinase [Bacteroidales bacterium]
MKIVGIGETVLDIVLRDGQAQAAVPGGSTFNAMISLGRTIGREHPEVPLLMVTQTGDDAVSQLVLSFMEANGIRPDGVVRSPGQSTLSVAMLDSRGNARYEFFRDKELPAFQAPDLSFEADDFVLFGSFFAISPETREQARLLVRRAREAGATVYYDINFRKNHNAADSLPQIEENMALSTIVRGSSEDIEALYGTADAAAVYERHIAPLCPNFICTKGARETEVFSPGVHLHFPVPQDTKVISTIGAGDNFNAGTLYALLTSRLTAGERQASEQQETTLSGNASANALASRPALKAQDWDRIVPIAHAFSANVVASLYNYVDPGFQP